MEKNRPPSIGQQTEDTQEIRLLEALDVSTETINIDNMWDPDLTSSGSFNFTWIGEAAFGKLLDAIPLPAMLVDGARTIVFLNRAAGKMADKSQGLLGSPLSSIFYDAKEMGKVESLLDGVVEDRKPKYLEGIVTILGNKMWGRMHLRAIRVSDQRLVLVLVEDLTAEKKRAVLNEKYRKLVHLLPTGIAEFSLAQPVPVEAPLDQALKVIAKGALVDGNDEFAGLHGASTAESILGATPDTLFPFQGHNRDLFAKWSRGGYGISSAEISSETGDGRIRHMECTLIGIVRRDKLHGFWFLRRDVTESRRMKEESFRAQKLESLGILAGGIAHDFNNSLTAILGNINLAKIRAPAEEAVFQRLVEAERACGRAKSLTDQLLTFAKGGPTIMRVGSIAQLLKDSAEFAFAGSDIGFEFSIPDDLWPVEFDEGQMSQVMSNLVINAQQAMVNGGFVSIDADNLVAVHDHNAGPSAGRYVKISVRDTGMGIPVEDQSRIFDPYFTTKEKGIGLGLATSYAIVRSHGGFMTVESELAVGTTFHVFLPASERAATHMPYVKEPGVGGKGRILLMDDEQMVRDVAHEMLRIIGYDVECVPDGCKAVEAYKRAQVDGSPFAAVIMNLTVPGGMGGKETIAELLMLDPNTRAIVSSGYPHDPVMDRFESFGFRGVVSKPYDLEELSGVLRSVIGSDLR